MKPIALVASVWTAALACGSPGKSNSATTAGPQPTSRAAALPEASELTRGLTWMVGHWVREGTSETWLQAGRVLIGVGFGVRQGKTAFFEVMIVEEVAPDQGQASPVVTFTALPGGLRAVDFVAKEMGRAQATFANPANRHPQSIGYRRDGPALVTTLASATRGKSELTWMAGKPAASPALEEIDRRFAADSAARGGEAWADVFVPEGALWTRKSQLITGADAIGTAVGRTLGDGQTDLEWAPFASGLSPAGDAGFTVGRYRLVRQPQGQAEQTLDVGTYLTIWHRQPDGAWRATFDAGIPDQQAIRTASPEPAHRREPCRAALAPGGEMLPPWPPARAAYGP